MTVPRSLRLALLIGSVAVLLMGGATGTSHGAGGVLVTTNDVRHSLGPTTMTIVADRASFQHTLYLHQELSIETDAAGWWVVPVQGAIASFAYDAAAAYPGNLTIDQPPNLCADLVPFQPPGGPGHGRPQNRYPIAEVAGEARIIGGEDVLAWADAQGLALGDALGLYATREWQFLAVPWDVVVIPPPQFSDGGISPENRVVFDVAITYQGLGPDVVVPLELLVAGASEDSRMGGLLVTVHVVSDVLYAPQSGHVAVPTTNSTLTNADNWNDNYQFYQPTVLEQIIEQTRTATPDRWVQIYGGPTTAPQQVTTYTRRVLPSDANKTFAFSPDPALAPLTSVTLATDPLQYWQCSTRALYAENTQIKMVGVDLANLPPQRHYIPDYQLTIFTPDGWVRSDVVYNTVPIIVFAPRVVTAEDIAAADGPSATSLPMVAVYRAYDYTTDLSTYFNIASRGNSFVLVGRPTTDNDRERTIVIKFSVNGDLWSANRDTFDAMLFVDRLYSAHPDLMHTLYLQPATTDAAQDGVLWQLDNLRIGFPEGYLESIDPASIDTDTARLSFSNPDTGATIWVDLTLDAACSPDGILPNDTDRLGYVATVGGLRATITTLDAVDDAILVAMAESLSAQMATSMASSDCG